MRSAGGSASILSERTSHNALLDCRLLAEVYIELTGGRQRGLSLAIEATPNGTDCRLPCESHADGAADHVPSAAELVAHASLVGRLKEALWVG